MRSRRFGVTSEVVPPRSSDPEPVERQARELVGYADAVNVTDNPTASAHMSPVAGAAIVARTGVEPTLQLTVRDRNRLAIAADLLGAWALGARNLLCLTGDPLSVGDEPDAAAVNDIGLLELIALASTLREGLEAPLGRRDRTGAPLLRRRGRQPAGRALRPGPSRGQAGRGRRVRHDPDRLRPGPAGRVGRDRPPARRVRTGGRVRRRRAAAEREAGPVHERAPAGRPRSGRPASARSRTPGPRPRRSGPPSASRSSRGSDRCRASRACT